MLMISFCSRVKGAGCGPALGTLKSRAVFLGSCLAKWRRGCTQTEPCSSSRTVTDSPALPPNGHLLTYSLAFLRTNTRSSERHLQPACSWGSGFAALMATVRGLSPHVLQAVSGTQPVQLPPSRWRQWRAETPGSAGGQCPPPREGKASSSISSEEVCKENIISPNVFIIQNYSSKGFHLAVAIIHNLRTWKCGSPR